MGKALFRVLTDYYERDPDVQSAEPFMFAELLKQAYPHNHDRVIQLHDSLDPDPPVENLRALLLEEKVQNYREQISVALMEKRDDEANELWAELATLRSGEDDDDADEYAGTDPEHLLATVEAGNRIPLVCAQLTGLTRGGALPGHHLLFFGRPEVGKSLVAFNLLDRAARAGYRVGFWENEDPIAATQLRAAQAICNATEEELRVGLAANRRNLAEAGWNDRIFFKESPDGSVAEIEEWVGRHNLDVVVVNQLPNLRTLQRDNRVLELFGLARGLRALAKRRRCVVASIAQAGDSAEGRRVLRLGDLDGSNTAVQGQVDLMVGIGADERALHQGHRIFTAIRNKLSGRLEPLQVTVDRWRNRVHD